MALLGELTAGSVYLDVAEAIVKETILRGYSRAESVAVLSTGIQESGLRPMAMSANGLWVGIYQQDTSYPGRFDPNKNIAEFLNRLDVKRASRGASDIWKNIFWLQQRPSEPSAEQAYQNGRKAYLTEIQRHIAEAERLYDLFSGGVVVVGRPDFNEYPKWSPSYSSRGGRKVDLFLLHTQEGNGNADGLAGYLGNPANKVSYHYTISQAADGGVTVVDVVDTDYSSWSVGDANPRSINLCFAGSFAGWSREQWLKISKAIDVAAYLAVQDCKKYGISTKVLKPPYNSNPPGISDHNYVTKWLKWGDHTDVGPNFPWDVFEASVKKYSGEQASGPVVVPPPVEVKPVPEDNVDGLSAAEQQELLTKVRYIYDQLGPGFDLWGEDGDLGRNAKGQRRTFRAGLAALVRKFGA